MENGLPVPKAFENFKKAWSVGRVRKNMCSLMLVKWWCPFPSCEMGERCWNQSFWPDFVEVVHNHRNLPWFSSLFTEKSPSKMCYPCLLTLISLAGQVAWGFLSLCMLVPANGAMWTQPTCLSLEHKPKLPGFWRSPNACDTKKKVVLKGWIKYIYDLLYKG